jgi:integrase
MGANEVGKVISTIGEKAKVVVSRSTKRVKEKADGQKRTVEKETTKFASAHDLRRAFCTRWAKRVMPATLQRLARHSHISTTLNYYVAATAGDIAADLWREFGNTSGNNQAPAAPKESQPNCCKSL